MVLLTFFSRLPMGLSISPSEMQDFACVTVKLVEKFRGVRGIAYMDDFLFVARHPSELNGVGDNSTQAGIVINYAKFVLSPVLDITYLSVDIHLDRAAICRISKCGFTDGATG
jgi:hypothetical protein